jgi:hypothetical protein
VSWHTALGLGISVIGLGWSVGGFLPYPRVGLLILAIGIVILLWPILTQVTGFDPFRPARVRKMARLLRQAADAEREAQRKHDQRQGAESADEVAARGWLYLKIGEFLDRGFAHHVRQDFDNYKASQEKKLGPNFKLHTTRADYLTRLAGRLKSSDLDPGFVMPEHFSQFDHTTWPRNM